MMRGMNMGKMMKQVKQLQKKMGSDQKKINQQKFTGTSPDNLVTVVLSGNYKMLDMKINPKAVDPNDTDMLSDLIISAVNDGLSKITKATQSTLGKYTKNIPGM